MSDRRRFGFRDPNGVLDRVAEMPRETRASFLGCLERVAREPDPLADPMVTSLRDPRYQGGFTVPFDDGILVYSGPHRLPPIAFIELIDILWLD